MRNPFRRRRDRSSGGGSPTLDESARHRKRIGASWQRVALAVALVVVAVAVYGVFRYYETQGDIQNRDITETQPREDNLEPFNALLVGSDSREGLTEEEQERLGAQDETASGEKLSDQNADTLILAHVDPSSGEVVMVQFPRDLYVRIARDGKGKINSALDAGADRLIGTVKDLTGLEIHHYLQVNIAGFKDLVDAIGGVELCITEPMPFDPQTGIEIEKEELGMVSFDGERALRFVRSRNFPEGDFARIRNQQRFLSAAIDKVLSTSTLLNPSRVDRLATIAGDNVEMDANTTLLGLKELAGHLRSFDPQRYEAYTAPNKGIVENEAGWVVLPHRRGIDLMFEALAANRSPAEADGVPEVPPPTVRVALYDATGQGVGPSVADELEKATNQGEGGVSIVDVAIPERRAGMPRTVIRHEAAAKEMAALVKVAMPRAAVKRGQTPEGVDVAVTLGERGRQVRPFLQLAPIAIPPPGDVPEECR